VTTAPGPDDVPPGPDNAGPDNAATTGHPEVDQTLATLDQLGSRPLDDHLEVLVHAHERLHATLDEHRGQDDGAGENDRHRGEGA